jgi:hypothetical protein
MKMVPDPTSPGDRPTQRPIAFLSITAGHPSEPDQSGDPHIYLNRRSLSRLMAVSMKVALDHNDGLEEPISWMLEPRPLFSGLSGLDACLDRSHFLRALACDRHGEIDRPTRTDLARRFPGLKSAGSTKPVSRALFTAAITNEPRGRHLHAFYAGIAGDLAEIVDRLRQRFGSEDAYANIYLGFGASDPLIHSLVSDALADLLRQIEDDPTSELAEGFDVIIEQRFAH